MSAVAIRRGTTPDQGPFDYANLRAHGRPSIMPHPKKARIEIPDVTGSTLRKLRSRLRMTQLEFAENFGLAWATVRDWEQERAKPDRAARAYLAVIGRDPVAVKAALSQPASV